jgi:hypothetical protein
MLRFAPTVRPPRPPALWNVMPPRPPFTVWASIITIVGWACARFLAWISSAIRRITVAHTPRSASAATAATPPARAGSGQAGGATGCPFGRGTASPRPSSGAGSAMARPDAPRRRTGARSASTRGPTTRRPRPSTPARPGPVSGSMQFPGRPERELSFTGCESSSQARRSPASPSARPSPRGSATGR